MRTLSALVLTACLAAAAAAQGSTAPAQPSPDKPALPSGDKPAMPSGEEPAQTGKISDWTDTTPERIQSPETPFFRPFRVEGSTAAAAAPPDAKVMKVDERTGELRLYTLKELKKKHTLELKALRKSLRNEPNSEIQKAVKLREAQQKADLKTLEFRLRAEREKNSKASSRPKPVIVSPGTSD